MEFFTTVKKRHSYRGGFQDVAVARWDLEKIVQAGLDAPSGKNAQTTQFVIVDDATLVWQIAQLHSTNKAVQQARVFIACILDKNPEAIYEGFAFQVEDCAAAVENMLLAITALGYASVWIDGWLRIEGRAQKIGQLLGLPDGKYIRVLLPIGMPAENYKQPAKKLFAQRVWFNRYGEK
ncbi:MAG: nitroreductase [Planctomycetes bacterium]|nr:nitroreductase [Planctomycetota bacterium]